MSILLSATQLFERMEHSSVLLVRALMDDPVSGTPDARDAEVLPNSVDIDLDKEGSDHTTGFPHSMPQADEFALYLGKLGLTQSKPIVVYDTRGIYSAPRVWWMLKSMGHAEVSLLDGGQVAWESAQLPTTKQQPISPTTYRASPQSGWFVNSSAVLRALDTQTQLVDARSYERFTGQASDPRPGVRAGHMPGAFNVPFINLLNNGQFLPPNELKRVFDLAGIDLSLPIICTCGSGVTACIVGMAALMCGANSVSVYDGSWSEWGACIDFPVVTNIEHKA